MSEINTLELAVAGYWLVQLGLPAAYFWFVRRPKLLVARAALIVNVSWILSVLYMAMIYNPVGLAQAKRLGLDDDFGKYDNNTIAVALLSGWIFPILSVSAVLILRVVLHSIKPKRGA